MSLPHVILGTNMVGGRFKAPDVEACLADFAAAGHSIIDTAGVYVGGKSEKVLGELGACKRFQVHTKCWPIKAGDHSRARLSAAIENSLKSLQTDSIPLFYLHSPDRATPILETLQTIDEYYRAGKIKALGLSNYTSYEVQKVAMVAEANGLLKPTVYQGIYNPIHRNIDAELLPCLRGLGMKFYAYSPLAGGLLSGNYERLDDPLPKTSRFNDKGWRSKYFNKLTFDGLNILRDACKAANVSMGEASLRWLMHHSALGAGDAVVLGGSSLQQFKNNIAWCGNGPLSKEVVEAFDSAYALAKVNEAVYFTPLPKQPSRL